ncbi:hypothetical protein ACIPPJ_05905 [Streptomyces sp. NPDC086091]|uniref:hypothetical protein n=1 Tax=Streptomyces sp. NPDC086091 TaxID=3365751 RepID=UPI0037F2CD74
MVKRPGAVALTAGALVALCCPGAALAQDARATGEPTVREISGGFAHWTAPDGQLADEGVSLDVTRPAVRPSADRASFPALGGSTDPAAGTADLRLGGAARFDGPSARPLVLGGLRLRLGADGGGALYGRTVVDGRAAELALADVASGAGPAVRATGVTWAGLRASLTAEGAALLSSWSGAEFTAGEPLGALELTLGTRAAGTGGSGSEGGSASGPGDSPSGGPSARPAPKPGDLEPGDAGPGSAPDAGAAPGSEAPAAGDGTLVATVAHATLAPGSRQTVTGEGFAPGAVVLVAIDGDTRYQAEAESGGRVTREFPVYATAFTGKHTVELTAVGGRPAVVSATFGVGTPS